MKFEQEARLTVTLGLLLIPVILFVVMHRMMETQEKVEVLNKQVKELRQVNDRRY